MDVLALLLAAYAVYCCVYVWLVFGDASMGLLNWRSWVLRERRSVKLEACLLVLLFICQSALIWLVLLL